MTVSIIIINFLSEKQERISSTIIRDITTKLFPMSSVFAYVLILQIFFNWIWYILLYYWFSMNGPQVPHGPRDHFRISKRSKLFSPHYWDVICLFYYVNICTNDAETMVGELLAPQLTLWHQIVLVLYSSILCTHS